MNFVTTADVDKSWDRFVESHPRATVAHLSAWGQIAREVVDGREVVRYSSADDLIVKTPGFYEYVARTRIDKKLGGVDRYAEAHFGGANLYQSEIDRNLNFLREAIANSELARRLRRAVYSLSNCKKHAAA